MTTTTCQNISVHWHTFHKSGNSNNITIVLLYTYSWNIVLLLKIISDKNSHHSKKKSAIFLTFFETIVCKKEKTVLFNLRGNIRVEL